MPNATKMDPNDILEKWIDKLIEKTSQEKSNYPQWISKSSSVDCIYKGFTTKIFTGDKLVEIQVTKDTPSLGVPVHYIGKIINPQDPLFEKSLKLFNLATEQIYKEETRDLGKKLKELAEALNEK